LRLVSCFFAREDHVMINTWKNKRVLITGGTGFIGSFLVEALLARGAKVRVPVRSENFRALSGQQGTFEWMIGDLRDSNYCAELVTGIDHVFHLAACRRNAEYHATHASQVLHENVRMTHALIDGLRATKPVPVTFFSTANIPPQSDVLSLSKAKTIDGYVLGKSLCELSWFIASRTHDFPLQIIRPVGTYGPRDTFSLDSNVIPALMYKAKRNTPALTVFGSGAQKRTFLYVEDFAEAVLRLVEANVTGVQYIHNEEVVTVKHLAEKIRDLVHPGLPIIFNEAKPQGSFSTRLPLHRSLKNFPWTSLDEGLQKTVDWWRGGQNIEAEASVALSAR